MDPIHYDGSSAVVESEYLPILFFGVDYNDANALNASYWIEQILSMPQHWVAQGGKPLTFTFVPQINRSVHAVSSGTNYEMVPSPSVWLDTAGYSQYHYGIKWGHTSAGQPAQTLGVMVFTAVVEFKSTKLGTEPSFLEVPPNHEEPAAVKVVPAKPAVATAAVPDKLPDKGDKSEYFLVRKA